jgi:hypothetical protein
LLFSLEARIVDTEIRLGHLFVTVAASAYNLRDVRRADEAKGRGEAACFRAGRVLAQVAESDRGALTGDLEFLRTELRDLCQEPEMGLRASDDAPPAEALTAPLEKYPPAKMPAVELALTSQRPREET